MERRIGIIDLHSIQTRPDDFKVISSEEYQSYKDSIIELETIYRTNKLFEVVEKNFEEFNRYFKDSINHLAEKMKTTLGVERKDGDDILINMNRYLLNYLSSTRAFIDHSETAINRKFGVNSEQYRIFKNNLSSYFDNSFAYRFLYKLRDYSVHCSLPFENISLAFKFLGGDKINIEVGVSFDSKRLLMNFDGWGRIVKKDLESASAQFNFYSLGIEVTEIIKEISKNIFLLERQKLIHSIEVVERIKETYKVGNHKLCFYTKIISTDERNGSYEMEYIPYELVDFFKALI